MRSIAQLVAEVACKYWDLGSIPRSPLIFHNFFLNMFPCRVHHKVHHTPNACACPNVPGDQSKGQDVRSIMHTSQPCHTQALKVNMGLGSVRQNASQTPPKGPKIPPCLYFLSLIFLFSFILVILIILFNSTKLILIIQKYKNTKKSEKSKIKYVYLLFDALIFCK